MPEMPSVLQHSSILQLSMGLETLQSWRPRQQGEVRYLITFRADAFFFLPLLPDSNLFQRSLEFVCISDLVLRKADLNQEWVRQQHKICPEANCARISVFIQRFISMFIRYMYICYIYCKYIYIHIIYTPTCMMYYSINDAWLIDKHEYTCACNHM